MLVIHSPDNNHKGQVSELLIVVLKNVGPDTFYMFPRVE